MAAPALVAATLPGRAEVFALVEEMERREACPVAAAETRTDAAPAAGAGAFLEQSRSVLEQVFGFRSFREGQVRVLEAIAAGKDCLVIMPTGSGKSLCYQVPALILPGVTLVVSPLIALMKDQVDGLKLRGAPVTFINSSLTLDEQWERLEGLRAGAYKLVYVAPERFRNRAFTRALGAVRVSLLAVDEAHCISQWGHDFRPDYRRLAQVRELLGGVRAVALTATATPEVQDDIARELKMADPERVVTGFDRPNLRYRVEPVRGAAQKDEALRSFLENLLKEANGRGIPPGIIYTGTRRHAESVAAMLDDCRLSGTEGQAGPLCRAYHAGLESDARRGVQEDFMEGRLPWVTATNAFGMGVDKSDIRFVVHYDLPGSIEAYYQEVGRAGRDGLPAECLHLFAAADRRLQEFFIDGSNPSRKVIEGVHNFLWSLGENPILRSLADLQEVFEYTAMSGENLNPLAFRSAVVILERASALERLDHSQNLAEVRARTEREWKQSPYPETAAVRRRLWESLQKVFERSDGDPAAIRLEHWAADMGLPLASLQRGLAHLVEDGWIDYIPPFRGRAIRLPEKRQSLVALGVDFAALQRRRRRDEEQLEKIVAFARSRQCRRNLILNHFGEELPTASCGRCDRCRENGGSQAAAREARPLDDRETIIVRKILSGIARARGRCGRRKVIQMLIGSHAQGVLDLGFERLSTYGILKGMKSDAVGEWIDHLEAAGCLRQEGDRYPVLHLTERGRKVMLAKETMEMPLSARPAPTARPEPPTPSRAEPETLDNHDEELFQRLRSLRRELASRLQVPAYRVFSDRTLKAMAKERPRDEKEILAIPGVGAVTLELFGHEFLREINPT